MDRNIERIEAEVTFRFKPEEREGWGPAIVTTVLMATEQCDANADALLEGFRLKNHQVRLRGDAAIAIMTNLTGRAEFFLKKAAAMQLMFTHAVCSGIIDGSIDVSPSNPDAEAVQVDEDDGKRTIEKMREVIKNRLHPPEENI